LSRVSRQAGHFGLDVDYKRVGERRGLAEDIG
jgi:hypothetical protein